AVGCVKMKLNFSFLATSCQKLIEVDDERKLPTFHEKSMATKVAADARVELLSFHLLESTAFF
ncbi:40S ribosomal protein S6-like protein, partial [Cricetulus griseus]